jgi:hypothetical protein
MDKMISFRLLIVCNCFKTKISPGKYRTLWELPHRFGNQCWITLTALENGPFSVGSRRELGVDAEA